MDSNKDSGISNVKRVLIALDYDLSAQKVAEKGYNIARTMKAKVILLHVVADDIYYSNLEYSPVTGFSGFSNSDFTIMANSEGLTKASLYFLEKTKEHLNDDSIRIITEKGEFHEMILNTATELDVDLIIMGSHSRRWLDQILMGSVTEKVLHHTSIPLLIIPTKAER
ncbi:MAG TPA: universal stress protein [Bacteroidales bacterium]|nr:universal stress protein [Bacteroidales bacterium]